MRNLLKYKAAFTFCLIVLLMGCGDNEPEPSPDSSDKDRGLILTHWVDKIVIPSYANFKVKLDGMQTKANAFTNAPNTTTLVEFRTAWVNAYAEWQKVELFEFGAADKYTLRNFFNIYPASIGGIAANIQNPSANLELAGSYAMQGFPALDYLINGVGADDAAIIAYYTTEPDAVKRVEYLKKLTARMNALLTSVIAEWNGPYRDTFISKTGLDIGSSMGLVVNAYVLQYERHIRSGKFGIPAGVLTSTPAPEKVEAYYKEDISQLLATNAHQAAIDFFNGVDVVTGVEGPSFKSYLNGLGAKDTSTGKLLSDLINDQFDLTEGKLDGLSSSFYEQIQSNNQKMIDVFTEMQKTVRMLKVDMTSAMSITITYTDNDGD